ncbi:hypothetical protein ACOIC6_28555, partial [Klebsiella pneumoniae]
LNQRGTVQNASDGGLDVDVAGNLDNHDGGLIASVGKVDVRGGALDNRDGARIFSTEGRLGVDTRGRTENAGGILQATGDV